MVQLMLFFCEFGILSFGRSLEFFCYSSAPARLSALNIFFCHYADLTSCLSLSIKTYFQLQVKCVCLKKPHKSNKTSYNFTLKSNDVATIRHDSIKSPIFCSLDIFFSQFTYYDEEWSLSTHSWIRQEILSL